MIPDYFDAHSNASAFAYNDGQSNTVAWLNGWKIPELSQQTLVALNEADKTKRQSLYTEMQKSYNVAHLMFLSIKVKTKL